jgi:hypothetical protein
MPKGDPQIWYGDTGGIILGYCSQGSEGSAESKVRVYVPDSRLRVKISLTFVRDNTGNASTPVTNLGATVYMGAEEQDRSGKNGAFLLVTDILREDDGTVVHQSTPLDIPENAGLDGFSWEFVTAADSVLVVFTTNAGINGHWVLQVRYQPDGQRLSDDDWDYVKRQCHAALISPQFSLV